MRTDVILSIGDLVRWAANEYGDRPLWIDATTGRTVTFGEYDATTDRIAAGLIGRGIEPGDRVATWFNNSIELLHQDRTLLFERYPSLSQSNVSRAKIYQESIPVMTVS